MGKILKRPAESAKSCIGRSTSVGLLVQGEWRETLATQAQAWQRNDGLRKKESLEVKAAKHWRYISPI